MDWQTILVIILSSGVVAAIVTGLINHFSQIKAIKESGLYARRIEVLDEFMKKWSYFNQAMEDALSPIRRENSVESRNMRRKTIIDSFNSFRDFFDSHNHYLNIRLSDKIHSFLKENKITASLLVYEIQPETGLPDHEEWVKLYERHHNEFDEERKEIANEFRKMIGVK